MSICAGKTACEIYRDKKFCRKGDGRKGVCDCSHVCYPCQVGTCIVKDICPIYEALKEGGADEQA